MAAEITVDDVPESVRDRLAENAADRSQSLEEYLRQELARIAAAPSVATLIEKIRRQQEATSTSVPTSATFAAHDDDSA